MNNTYKIHVSRATSKLGDSIPTVNFPPRVYCNREAPCVLKDCYACKGHFTFPAVKKTMEENMMLWEMYPDDFFKQLDSYLYLNPVKFFRWFSSGDIPNVEFLDRMSKLARNHTETAFLCFTKKYLIVDSYVLNHRIPKNLTIVYSTWKDFVPKNPYHFPMSYVRFKKENYLIPKDALECSHFCGECVMGKTNCWVLKKGESVVFDKH